MDKLLELIEERKLDINELSLAAVTDDFLKHLNTLRREMLAGGKNRPPEEDMRLLADFIVVASRLILAKSKSLLPELSLTSEEEKDIKDLEARLAMYQKLKGAMRHVHAEWRSERFSVSRPYFMHLQSGASVFYPGGGLNQALVLTAISSVYESLQKFVLETKTIGETIISLEETMQGIIRRMEAATETTLQNLAGGSKSELVAAFLAVLHLAREQLVFLEQQSAFSDIIVRKKEEKGENTGLNQEFLPAA